MGGGMLWILPTSVGDFAHTDGGDWFNRVKWSVFPKPSLELPKTEQIKDAQGLFNSTGCLFWWHSEIQELFLPFGKLAIVIGANKWVETEELGRKRHVSLKEPKGKGTGPSFTQGKHACVGPSTRGGPEMVCTCLRTGPDPRDPQRRQGHWQTWAPQVDPCILFWIKGG